MKSSVCVESQTGDLLDSWVSIIELDKKGKKEAVGLLNLLTVSRWGKVEERVYVLWDHWHTTASEVESL